VVACLPVDVRRGFVVGTLLFGTGAVAVEALSGWVDVRYGSARLYALVTAVEEGLEMCGCIVVLAAVLAMLRMTSVMGSPALALRSALDGARGELRSEQVDEPADDGDEDRGRDADQPEHEQDGQQARQGGRRPRPRFSQRT
jgi:hypothetical protein